MTEQDRGIRVDKPITVGDLVNRVTDHLETHADVETLEAWAQLVEVFAATVQLLDGSDRPIGVCAWCRHPSATWDEVQAHIETCAVRRELSERAEYQEVATGDRNYHPWRLTPDGDGDGCACGAPEDHPVHRGSGHRTGEKT